MKRTLITPLAAEEIEDVRIGDVLYLSGQLVTCRDVAHRRLVEYGISLPVDICGGAIFHAGPIVRKLEGDRYQMISVGPTTSMRMEKFEKEFIRQTGVRVIVGKGGMARETTEACRKYKAIHCVFPAGCAVVAADAVEAIERAEWTDMGMPETLWVCRVRAFGPLIVSIDTHGGNLFERNKAEFLRRADEETERIREKLHFIK